MKHIMLHNSMIVIIEEIVLGDFGFCELEDAVLLGARARCKPSNQANRYLNTRATSGTFT